MNSLNLAEAKKGEENEEKPKTAYKRSEVNTLNRPRSRAVFNKNAHIDSPPRPTQRRRKGSAKRRIAISVIYRTFLRSFLHFFRKLSKIIKAVEVNK
jgi:hypothetical protein